MTGVCKTSFVRMLVVLAVVLLPAGACGPGGSVYVGVSGPGPWTSYPGGYYPGAWGYPGYRWEEEQDEEEQDVEQQDVEEQGAAELVEWEAPWAGPGAPTLPTPEEDAWS